MSHMLDAIALVSARSHYTARARALEAEAREQRAKNRPLTAKAIESNAKLAQKAAMAELINPEPRE